MAEFKYQIEDFEAVRHQMDDLIRAHWEEVALNQDKIPLDPDWSFYEALWNAGLLGIYTVRLEGKLVGYFVVVAKPHPHYKQNVFASNDIIYLSPEYRKSSVGAGLISFAENDLKERGVSVLVVNTKVHRPFDPLLERLGFNKIEHTYSKYIGD